MAIGPGQRALIRRLRIHFMRGRAPAKRKRAPLSRKRHPYLLPVLLTVAVGVLLAVNLIRLLEARMAPVVTAIARANAQNTMISVLEHAVAEDLSKREVGYADFISIERDESGSITALTADMGALNLLRADLVSTALNALYEVEVSEIQVPLGSLFDSDLAWARGPSIHARDMSIGTVTAEFKREFIAAGINQTLHRICLEWDIPITLLFAGFQVEVPVETSLCVAETVIVGRVPDTYLELPASLG